ncbi:MAG TPA: hypothetical protein VMA77_12500 [Solirubrobacteraceae bacterium]|nr:hypothetical protein [Solirubrobacteraceae bacterium]
MTKSRTRAAAIGLTCAVAVGACGGSSDKPSTTASSNSQSQGLKFSECMRSHGITNFPDPGSSGGIQLSSSSGINPFSPAFKAAQAACGKLLPGGGPGGNGHPSAQAKKQMLEISECMRAHGVTGFPDPTTTPPSSPPGGGIALGHDGVFLIVPSTIDINSPAFKQAATTCHFGGPGGP